MEIHDLINTYGSDDDEMELLFSSSSSSSESESLSESEDEEHVKVSNFIETIEAYSEADFKRHFRVNRATTLQLIGKNNIFFYMYKKFFLFI